MAFEIYDEHGRLTVHKNTKKMNVFFSSEEHTLRLEGLPQGPRYFIVMATSSKSSLMIQNSIPRGQLYGSDRVSHNNNDSGGQFHQPPITMTVPKS